TVNATPLLSVPPTFTTMLPVVAPAGTRATILESLQLEALAAVPLNLTVLVPWVAPKLAPEIVTTAVTIPDDGEMPAIPGAFVTVKFTPLLATLETVTTTLPVVAPAGTRAVIPAPVQLVGEAAVPLKVTVLEP